jgi:hypothetical protein
VEAFINGADRSVERAKVELVYRLKNIGDKRNQTKKLYIQAVEDDE